MFEIEKEHTYHIIRNGVKEEVTATQLHQLSEAKEHKVFDIDWYLSHGYVTLEEVIRQNELKRDNM